MDTKPEGEVGKRKFFPGPAGHWLVRLAAPRWGQAAAWQVSGPPPPGPAPCRSSSDSAIRARQRQCGLSRDGLSKPCSEVKSSSAASSVRPFKTRAFLILVPRPLWSPPDKAPRAWLLPSL